jgi:hypothetical protein
MTADILSGDPDAITEAHEALAHDAPHAAAGACPTTSQPPPSTCE